MDTVKRYKITLPAEVNPGDPQVTITLPPPGREKLKFNRDRKQLQVTSMLSDAGAAHARGLGLGVEQVAGPAEEKARVKVAAGVGEALAAAAGKSEKAGGGKKARVE